MAFFVELAPAVLNHIASVEGLSPQGRQHVINETIDELSRDAERFLALFPLGPESMHFRYEYPHPESGVLYTFTFVVDGTDMAVGVVQVPYVEHETQAIP